MESRTLRLFGQETKWMPTASLSTRWHRIQNTSELRRCRTPRNGEQDSSPIWARDEVDADSEPRRSRSPPSSDINKAVSQWTSHNTNSWSTAAATLSTAEQTRLFLVIGLPGAKLGVKLSVRYEKLLTLVQKFFQTDPPNRCWRGSLSIGKM